MTGPEANRLAGTMVLADVELGSGPENPQNPRRPKSQGKTLKYQSKAFVA